MKWLDIGQGHYISAVEHNPRVWSHLEKVEKKMLGLEMGSFFHTWEPVWTTFSVTMSWTLQKGLNLWTKVHSSI